MAPTGGYVEQGSIWFIQQLRPHCSHSVMTCVSTWGHLSSIKRNKCLPSGVSNTMVCFTSKTKSKLWWADHFEANSQCQHPKSLKQSRDKMDPLGCRELLTTIYCLTIKTKDKCSQGSLKKKRLLNGYFARNGALCNLYMA